MSDTKNNKNSHANKVPNLSEVFGDDVKMDVTARDVFAGGLSGVGQDRTAQPEASGQHSGQVGSAAAQKSVSLTQIILVVNMIILTGLIVYLVHSSSKPAIVAGETSGDAPRSTAPAAQAVPEDITDPAHVLHTIGLKSSITDVLDEAISLQTAERLYASGDYLKAAYVYERLRGNISPRTEHHEALIDWLTLQMALCLQNTQEQHLMSELFTRALNSRSPVVQALAHYNVAFIQNHNRNYLEARRHAYQTLALLRTIEAYMPPTLEADCYFLAAEALTRYLLRTSNRGDNLPGSSWSNAQPIYSLPITDQEQLGYLLTEGMERLSDAAMAPVVEYNSQRSSGARWSAFALQGPLDQFLWQLASEADINLNLSSLSGLSRRHKTTLYLPLVDRNYLAEVAVGTAGLIWQFDGQAATVHDLSSFADSQSLQAMLIQETIAVWQRFILRYRGDHRAANAHYTLGKLYAMADEPSMSSSAYRLVATHHADNPLAPYALLGSSKVKIGLRDYVGAKSDLNELLSQYPNSKITDEAMLYLAEATMENGNYAEAAEMFRRVYHLDISRQARRQASFGLGKCAYKRGYYEEAAKWLADTLPLLSDRNDTLLAATCLMLGQSLIHTHDYDQASRILQKALGAELSHREYVQIALHLADAETQRRQYVSALNILERIPESRLGQEDAVEVMIARSRLYRHIDVPMPAISLLRRQIEFIAESRLRARLSLELAECYLQNGELTPARRALNEAMPHLPSGRDTQRAAFLLARIAHDNQNYALAESLSLEALELDSDDQALRREIYTLLGTVYAEQEDYNRAAMAYAGLLGRGDVQ